jgi:prepilin peptidase CpaA
VIAASAEMAELARIEWLVAAAVGIVASVEDLARRTISNWIVLAALIAGIGCQVFAKGWIGIGHGLFGAVAGFAVFLIFYVLGGMGGGDVKLMAGFGAMLGTGRLLHAAFFTALTGGIMAAVVLGWAAVRRGLSREKPSESRPASIPYAPAIALGVWLTLLSAK